MGEEKVKRKRKTSTPRLGFSVGQIIHKLNEKKDLIKGTVESITLRPLLIQILWEDGIRTYEFSVNGLIIKK